MYQSLTIVGNLGRDPEMRYMADGTPVVNFSLAVNQPTKGGKATMWVRVTAWGKTAENCNQYLTKGSQVLVEGRLNFEHDTGGPKIFEGKAGYRASFEMTANSVRFLSSPSHAEGEGVTEPDEQSEEGLPV